MLETNKKKNNNNFFLKCWSENKQKSIHFGIHRLTLKELRKDRKTIARFSYLQQFVTFQQIFFFFFLVCARAQSNKVKPSNQIMIM